MSTNLPQLIKKQRTELLSEDANNLEAIARAYSAMYGRLDGDIDALMLAIENMDEPTRAKIQASPQYKRLVKNAKSELDKFTVYLETIIGTSALAAITLGLKHSKDLVNSMVGGGFQGLEPGVMPQLLKYLSQDGPLYARLKQLTGVTVDKVIQSIIDGVASGYNPRKIAGMVQDAFGGGLTDALRNIRTVQLYAYRDSARANYMASDVVTGWVWFAELDTDVCMSCVAMHGTIHDLSETLDDHYNGRCAAIPYIPGVTGDIQSGEDWFNNLGEATQREMMGDPKYKAWKDGQIDDFSKLAKQVDNPVYGKMRTEASLLDILGDKAKDYYSYDYRNPPSPLMNRFVEVKPAKYSGEKSAPIVKDTPAVMPRSEKWNRLE
jgi:hypothetical protein